MSTENDDKDSWWKKASSGVSSLYEKGSTNVQDQFKTMMDGPKPGAKSDEKNDELPKPDEQMLNDMGKMVREINEELTKISLEMMSKMIGNFSSSIRSAWEGSAANKENTTSFNDTGNNETSLTNGIPDVVKFEAPSPLSTTPEPPNIKELDVDEKAVFLRDKIASEVSNSKLFNDEQKKEINTVLDTFNDPSFNMKDKINCLQNTLNKIDGFSADIKFGKENIANAI